MNRINFQAFGKDSAPTIYYLVGHGGKIKQYRWHIRFLTLSGFRVMAFDYDPKVFSAGEPHRLPEIVDQITKVVQDDQKDHKVRGLYGVSLGSFIGPNVMARAGIEKGMFNTGPADMVKIVWDAPAFDGMKPAFVKKGHSRESVAKLWEGLQAPAVASKLSHAKLLCMNSRDDKIIIFSNSQEAEHVLREAGAQVQTITSRWLGHVGTIFRNSFRFQTTKNFFK